MSRAAVKAKRDLSQIRLLAVSKGQSPERIRECLQDSAFPRDLGENYFEELSIKEATFTAEHLTWHYLGRLQSRKIGEICARAAYLHGVSRTKEIEAVERAPRIPKFFLQVNISRETQKGGFEPDAIESALEFIAKRPLLSERFVGFMGIAAPLGEFGEKIVRGQFSSLRELRDKLCPEGLLSMGMSDDLEIAIEEGANWVRVGTALFGARL
jgi:pyridoxal phosphate enzyme (YggS family)